MGVRVRAARIEDCDAIVSAWIRAWQVAYEGLLPAEMIAALDHGERLAVLRRSNFGAELQPGARLWVAETAEGVLGFSRTGPARDEALPPESHELWAIYAHPDAWGQGVGRALIEKTLADLRARGFAEVVLWYLSENERAGRFYEKAGFLPDPRVEPSEFRDSGAIKTRLRYVFE